MMTTGEVSGNFLIYAAWTAIWQSVGLWKAARRNEPIWFMSMIVLGAGGFLPIAYLFLFNEEDGKKKRKA
jgi:hypothetical protein